MLNATYFRRATKVALDDVSLTTRIGGNKQVVASLDQNLRTLGYTLHGDLAQALLSVPAADIKVVFDEIIKEAKEIKGVRNYRPMYRNFPTQVMEASEGELYFNALIHYWSAGTLLPLHKEEPRTVLDFSEDKYTVINVGTADDFVALMNNLIHSKSGFSETDKGDITYFAANATAAFFRCIGQTSDGMTNRENTAFIAALAYRHGRYISAVKGDTATDVLRFAVALSDGDTSLSDRTNFRKFSRPERRMLLSFLNEIQGDIVEDMMRNQQTWKRLGERLHPGEFTQYPKAVKAFAAVRSNDSVETFNAKVEKAIARKDVNDAIDLLVQRPGEFARRLDKVMRMSDSAAVRSLVLFKFQGVAQKVSPTVLIQTRNAFVNRKASDTRVFFPKGSIAKMQVKKDERESIRKIEIASVVNIIDGALGQIFSDREPLGSVFVDPALKGVAIPFGMRNASKALKTLGRGSRLPLDADTGIVRFFIWWKNAESDSDWYSSGHTDIDLSAVCLDENFGRVFDITYYNLRENGAVHSGDITNAPEGASEFIDIDIERLRKRGARYVAMTLHSYSGHGFVELPECFAGFMQRTGLGDSGEIFDPRTVTNKVDLTANTQGATPFIFDLETGEAIWVDLSMKVQPRMANAYNSSEVTKTVAQAMVELTPPNLYDLFTAHAQARGVLVPRDKATTVFAFDGDVTPFDTEEILANYL